MRTPDFETQFARTIGVVFLGLGWLIAASLVAGIIYMRGWIGAYSTDVQKDWLYVFALTPVVYLTVMLIIAMLPMPRKVALRYLVGANVVGFALAVWAAILSSEPAEVPWKIAPLILVMMFSTMVSWVLHRPRL